MPESTATESDAHACAVLHPNGRAVELLDGRLAYVYPVGLRDLAAFSAAIGRATARMAEHWPGDDDEVDVTGEDDHRAGDFIGAVTAVVSEDLMELVVRCTRVDGKALDLEALDLADAAALIDAWLGENFDNPKRRAPIVRLADRVISTMTGGKTSISAMLSRFSSDMDSAPTTSSTDNSRGSRIPDGPSHS